jgi:hypothetical protein
MVFNKMAAKTIWKPDPKSVREMAIRKPDDPAFGCILYPDLGDLGSVPKYQSLKVFTGHLKEVDQLKMFVKNHLKFVVLNKI